MHVRRGLETNFYAWLILFSRWRLWRSIQERQEAVLRGDDTPQDILAHILRVAEEDPSLTLEDLVDEFVTFFVAGQVAEEFVTLFGVLQVMLSHFD